jgi:hypothetical protein
MSSTFGDNMKKLLIILLVITSIAFYFYLDDLKVRVSVLQDEIAFYQKVIDEETTYLKTLQLDDGVIVMYNFNGETARVVPYFSNLAAYALAKSEENSDEVVHYLDWYLANLNTSKTDKYGIEGTMFDYDIVVNNGELEYISSEDYDSIDSYAATFLMVVAELYESTEDESFILSNESEIEKVYQALMAVEKDGLFINSFKREVKYLMDNIEVVYGLEKYLTILNDVLIPSGTLNYDERNEYLVELIEDAKYKIAYEMYDFDLEVFHIGYDRDDDILEFGEYTNFYPDMAAQIFPVIFDVIHPESVEALNGYKIHKEIYGLDLYAAIDHGESSFYWTVQGYYYSKLGKSNKVKTYLEAYQEKFSTSRSYPLYNADVGWVILTCENEKAKLEDQLNKLDKYNIIRKYFLN